MGCGASRLEGGATVFPAKLRPIFLHRLDDIRLRRHTRPSKDFISTPSKKELLSADREEDEDTASSSHKNGFKTAPVSPENEKEVGGSHHQMQDVKSKEEEEEEDKFFTDFENDEAEKEEDDKNDRRIISREGGFPGSPSFRVYFKEDEKSEEEDITGKNDALKKMILGDETSSSKESSENSMKVRRRMRSFRKVFPRGGQVKNLLNVTSCYTPHPTIHDSTRLLPDKTISN